MYAIPIPGGEVLNEEMNAFLRSKQILRVDHYVVNNPSGNFWCYSIHYLDDIADKKRFKVDYREVLDEATFARFSKMREVRKQLALEEGVPPYVIFTDEELAALAKVVPLTLAAMRALEGVGEKKVEKYGAKFVQPPQP